MINKGFGSRNAGAARALIFAATILIAAAGGRAADFAVKMVDKAPPAELGDAIRKALPSKAVQLSEGTEPVFEFWFSQPIPLKSKPESADKALKAIAETTLLGAVAVHRDERDYKDNEIIPGVYTMRFALQPQDGDHLGTALYPYFVVLVPARLDQAPDALTRYKPLVKASGKETATGHPVVMSLRPPSTTEGKTPVLNEPAPEHKSVRLQVPAKVSDGGEETSLLFELVYEGHGKID